MGNEKVVVVIPARNEIYLQKTVDGILEKAQGDIEVVAVMDAYEEKFCRENNLPWPMVVDQEVKGHPKYDIRVIAIHHNRPTGQRASTNEGARASDAKYFIKADAHVLFDEGFDIKLKERYEPEWTVMPWMYIIDAAIEINTCPVCGGRIGRKNDANPYWCNACQKGYTSEEECPKIPNPAYWTPKWHKDMDYMYISNEPGLIHRAQYWNRFRRRPEARKAQRDKGLVEVMTGQGAVWFQDRQRFLDMGGLDESHGSWGQVGMEIACKAWLSGGRHLINKATWFAHWFRGNNPGFPYDNPGARQTYARDYSRDLWRNGKWELQVRPLTWLVRKFWPVPSWFFYRCPICQEPLNTKFDETGKHICDNWCPKCEKDYSAELSQCIMDQSAVTSLDATCRRKAIIYYTDNSLSDGLARLVQERLRQAAKLAGNIRIICVSQKPMSFGDINICVGESGRSHLSMFRQIFAGVENSQADTIYLAEHDCLYTPQHFSVVLHTDDKFCYNTNVNYVRHRISGHGTYIQVTPNRKLMSQLISGREILIQALKERIAILEHGLDMPRGILGVCEPGANEKEFGLAVKKQCTEKKIDPSFMEGYFSWQSDMFQEQYPNLDIRHGGNFSHGRKGESLGLVIPYWGKWDNVRQSRQWKYPQ